MYKCRYIHKDFLLKSYLHHFRTQALKFSQYYFMYKLSIHKFPINMLIKTNYSGSLCKSVLGQSTSSCPWGMQVLVFWCSNLFNNWPSFVRLKMFLLLSVLVGCNSINGKLMLVTLLFLCNLGTEMHRITHQILIDFFSWDNLTPPSPALSVLSYGSLNMWNSWLPSLRNWVIDDHLLLMDDSEFHRVCWHNALTEYSFVESVLLITILDFSTEVR